MGAPSWCCTDSTGAVPTNPASSIDASDAPFDARDAHQSGDASHNGDAAPDSTSSDSPADSGTDALSQENAWLYDEAVWKRVTSVPECDAFEAEATNLDYPHYEWSDCGQGCTTSPVLATTALAYGQLSASSARVVSGRPYLSLTVLMPTGAQLTILIDAQSGTIVSAVRTEKPCLGLFAGIGTTRVMYVFATGGGTQRAIAWLPLSPDGHAVWSPNRIVPSWQAFDLGDTWGGVQDNAAIRIADSPSTGSLNTIFADGWLGDGLGLGDTAFWIRWKAPHASLGRWRAADGAVSLVEPSHDIVRMDVHPSRIVWLGAHGPNVSDGEYEAAEVYWSDFTTQPSSIVVYQGPSLPLPHAPSRMSTNGSWAAFPRCESDTDCATILVQLDQQKVWRLPSRPGNRSRLLGFFDSHVVLGETDPAILADDRYFVRILKYDLAVVDSFATPLP